MSMEIKIGKKVISSKSPVFIIAEAGVNHNGRLDLALKLVDAAADAGADAVKFQTFRAEQVVIPEVETAGYQKKNTGKTESQFAMLKQLELKEEYYPELIKYAKKKNIIFLSTPHGGFESVDFLNSLKTPALKFGSGDLNNLPLLQYAAKLKKPMIISTGMSTLQEIKEAVNAIGKTGNNQIIILHCVSNYPAQFSEINLRILPFFMRKFKFPIGYSDHTLGGEASLAAVSLGANVIEKHITIDKNLSGPDHVCSLNPTEFKQLVSGIRNIEKGLGRAEKKLTQSEIKISKVAKKSVVAVKDIKKGEVFNSENIGIKRPGTGLPPKYYFSILSKICLSNVKADTLISKKHYEE